MFQRLALDLPIPIQETKHETVGVSYTETTTYHVEPGDYLKFFMHECPDLLCGPGDWKENLQSFWSLYQCHHPQHSVFQQHAAENHKYIVPLCVHGDEGRGLKATNYLVCSIQSPIEGLAQDKSDMPACSCASCLAGRNDLPAFPGPPQAVSLDQVSCARRMMTNYKGHSYLSRFLIFGLGAWIYKEQGHVVTRMFEIFTLSMQKLFEEGVVLPNGIKVYAATVTLKGDMSFHRECMQLQRCYSRLGSKNSYAICHACLAGRPPHMWEDFRENPGWAQTLWVQRPWDAASPPALSNLPFNATAPERMLQGDVFHIFKVGVGRDIVGGVVVLLSRLGFFDHPRASTSIKERLKRCHGSFVLFCLANHKKPGLRSFTPSFFGIKSLAMSCPSANSKGSDTMLLLKWCLWVCRLNCKFPTVLGHDELLEGMAQTCQAGIDAFRLMHSHPLFLERACARHLYVLFMRIIRGYRWLGRQALTMGKRCFALKPKAHALHHCAYNLRSDLSNGNILVPSPQMYSCEIDEDFMGRICRLSRKVNIRTTDRQVIMRYFLKVNALKRRSFGQCVGIRKG